MAAKAWYLKRRQPRRSWNSSSWAAERKGGEEEEEDGVEDRTGAGDAEGGDDTGWNGR